jgi:hypothetical protein
MKYAGLSGLQAVYAKRFDVAVDAIQNPGFCGRSVTTQA